MAGTARATWHRQWGTSKMTGTPGVDGVAGFAFFDRRPADDVRPGSPQRGSVIVKAVPWRGPLSTSMRPPWLVTIRQHFDSPKPRPRPAWREE